MDTIPLCHDSQLILVNADALPLALREPRRFAGALAPDGETCRAWAQKFDSLPVGLALDCPAVPEDEEPRPHTLRYIERCKAVFRDRLHDDAAFYYVRGASGFPALRAAVLALTDLSGRTVIAELPVEDDEGHMPDGTETRAAIGVLQRIGVSTVILAAHTPEALTETLEEVAPYARLSVGVSIHSAWLRAGTPLYNTELFLPVEHDGEARLLEALEAHGELRTVPRDHDDFILAPDGNHAHFIDPTIDISDEIEVGHRLEEALVDFEDESGALKLVLETEDDVIALEEQRHMISRPVCLCAESAELLEQGLRVYPGLALYDGTWEQPEEVLHYLEQKYGLIRL
ncbi:hypothetical protein [Agathobaculum sp.]|uniref:hypothetical protein n=1 Tax=Agathobaculum sp. TaxID=2048138 RepID=UPI002A840FE3|nr:hypothetical protein [Agathobaculum sp.]MDY3618196.1 hypothetical protein [Agathobaculum sp.]